jgi:hypothetical protein
MSDDPKTRHDCPNCGTPLKPEFEFCPTCGQQSHDLKLPFRHMAYEFFENLTHFDTKVWNTLKSLVVPGRITNEFLAGKRARHVPPARLYILVSVLFFFVLGSLMNRGIQRNEVAVNDPPQAGADDRDIRVYQTDSADEGGVNFTFQIDELSRHVLRERRDELTAAELDSVLLTMHNTPNWFHRRLLAAVIAMPEGDEAGDYVVHQAVRSISLLMFLLMPFTALLLKVFFSWKRLYYEHLIFSIQTHTAIFLLLTLGCAYRLAFHEAGAAFVQWLLFLTCLAYLVLALRRVYRRSWFATASLTVVMFFPYFIMFTALFCMGILFGFLLG